MSGVRLRHVLVEQLAIRLGEQTTLAKSLVMRSSRVPPSRTGRMRAPCRGCDNMSHSQIHSSRLEFFLPGNACSRNDALPG